LLVAKQFLLAELYSTLQAAFDWSDDHLYTFQIRGWQFGDSTRAIELALAGGGVDSTRRARWSACEFRIWIQLIIEDATGATTGTDMAVIERPHSDSLIGPRLEEAKAMTGAV
jgi:hypothetical protein